MRVIDTKISTNRFQADMIAKQYGGNLPIYSVVDAFKHNPKKHVHGTYWAREWVVKNVCIGHNNDFLDKNTGVLLPFLDIINAHKARIEAGKSGIIGVDNSFFLIDPEAITCENGIYVFQHPKIIVVENAVTLSGRFSKGKADPITKIAISVDKKILNALPVKEIRWNFINNGIWPLACGGDDFLIKNIVIGDSHPSSDFRVLASTENKVQSRNKKES